MYTLRIIETDGREVNMYLGNHYTIYKKESTNKEDFDFKLEKYFGEDIDDDKIKSFIDSENLPNSLPLYWDKAQYIVNDSGKTFQKL
jgi:hypothetical protein